VKVLNVGISYHAPFESMEEEEIGTVCSSRKSMDVNYLGFLYCTYYALPHLKKSKGQIRVVGSLSLLYEQRTAVLNLQFMISSRH